MINAILFCHSEDTQLLRTFEAVIKHKIEFYVNLKPGAPDLRSTGLSACPLREFVFCRRCGYHPVRVGDLYRDADACGAVVQGDHR